MDVIKTNEKLDYDDKIEAGNKMKKMKKRTKILAKSNVYLKEYTVEFDIEAERSNSI